MADLNFQQLSTVQSNLQQGPVTMASATTIAPTTFMTLVTGTTNIATITPPVSGQHMLVLIATTTSPMSLLTTGNILLGSTVLVQNKPVLLFFNPDSAKYYPVVPLT